MHLVHCDVVFAPHHASNDSTGAIYGIWIESDDATTLKVSLTKVLVACIGQVNAMVVLI